MPVLPRCSEARESMAFSMTSAEPLHARATAIARFSQNLPCVRSGSKIELLQSLPCCARAANRTTVENREDEPRHREIHRQLRSAGKDRRGRHGGDLPRPAPRQRHDRRHQDHAAAHGAATPSCSSASSRSSGPPAGSIIPTSSAPSTTATTATSPYLVMEFVEGESLGQKLEREGRMSETEAIRIIAQVAQGLHRAHKQNLVHRDVKPDNILVTPDGVAKLADLGLVKETETDLNLTQDRPRPGHAALHGPRAVPQRQERRHPLRHLQPGRHALPDGDRRIAVPLQRPARRLDEEDPERTDAAAASWCPACRSASTGPSAGP